MKTFLVDGVPLVDQTYRSNLVKQFITPAGADFIDLGCNEGYESVAMASLGARRVVSIDGRDRYVEHTNAFAREKGFSTIQAKQADVRRIDELNLGAFDHVICFGLLYHMANPFNLLKRLRNLCRKNLFLETHVAPPTKKGLLPKHERGISAYTAHVRLDGVEFDGRIWMNEVPDIRKTTGSLDSQRTFWLSVDSLKKALELSGFRIKEFLYDPIPAKYEPWASLTNLGHSNTKIFAYCEVMYPGKMIPVMPLENPTLPIHLDERLRIRYRKSVNALKDRIGWWRWKDKLKRFR